MKYTVEFTYTMEVDAKDSLDAYDKAIEEAKKLDPEDFWVYVDGNLYS